jgi:hypothetical protein
MDSATLSFLDATQSSKGAEALALLLDGMLGITGCQLRFDLSC